jgi:phospholipid N-methyltransferase
MIISDLVRLKLSLKKLSTNNLDNSVNDLLFNFKRIDEISNYSELTNYHGQFDDISTLLLKGSNDINATVQQLINKINEELTSRTKNYLSRGYIINDGHGSDNSDIVTERHRTLPLTEEQKMQLIVIIRKYTSWKYPTLEIGPGDGEWSEHLVAGDPLYLVDLYQEFFDNTLRRFSEQYKKRVRPYLINLGDQDKFADLSVLPQEQFGFVFAWNVFNYFPLAETQSYLIESFKLLRPGGAMMFSYNNCDTLDGVTSFENGMKSWMTEDLLIETCKNIGFDIINSFTEESNLHWVEIQKPGILKTVKAAQAMGRILFKR